MGFEMGARETAPMTNDREVQFIERIAERLGDSADSTTIFGAPVESDGVVVIPVARARLGFGGGTGRQREGEEGGGGGGGLVVTPVGFIELRKGHSSFKRISAQRYLAPLLFLAAGALIWASRRRKIILAEE